MKKPVLLFVVNVDWFFLSHRLPLALAARDAGFEVQVATTLTGSEDTITSYGFKLHVLDIDRHSTNPLDALRLLWTLYRLMKRLHPDVVHLVTSKPVLLGGLAARWSGIPRIVAAISGLGLVFTARGPVAWVRRNIVLVLYRFALANNRVQVIFQNVNDQALLQRYSGIRDEQVVLIRGSGVDLSEWAMQPIPDKPPCVIMAARLLIDKGVCEFVEAARRLRGYQSARFILAGDVDTGNPSSLTREKVLSWVDEGIIDWWEYCYDMQAVFAQVHLVVLPSYREGLPKVLIEAAACGRAVVTTDVPGCRDAIDPMRTGLLVKVRNVDTLVQAIQSLLDDPLRLQTMGEAGRLWAERMFDVKEVIACHLALYRDAPYQQ